VQWPHARRPMHGWRRLTSAGKPHVTKRLTFILVTPTLYFLSPFFGWIANWGRGELLTLEEERIKPFRVHQQRFTTRRGTPMTTRRRSRQGLGDGRYGPIAQAIAAPSGCGRGHRLGTRAHVAVDHGQRTQVGAALSACEATRKIDPSCR
jgi:hypothetical protein